MSISGHIPKRFFSQHGEDYLLDLMFRDQPSGIFVEIGCIDGLRFSNTLALEKRGWRGLCIEAHSDYIDLLKRNRPQSTVVHCAVGDWDNAQVAFFANARGSLSTLDPALETRWRADFGEYFTGFQEQRVTLRTITSLLRENVMPPVDVLSIDVEGCEVNVLQGLDIAQHRPRVIIIECEGADQEQEIDAILLPGGYIKGFHVGANIFYSTEARLLSAVAGRCHDIVLTYTQHPLDRDGDKTQRVSVDLTAVRLAVTQAMDAGLRDAELQRLMGELRCFDPTNQTFEVAFALERALTELCSLDAGLLDTLPQPDHWTTYARALMVEWRRDYQAALPLFESVMNSFPDDWRPAYHLARCADATRQALWMHRAEELHWDILRRYPECAPSRHFLDDNMRRFAFHGDPQYQGMVSTLLNQLPVSDFVETGTFLGRSTAFVAQRWPDVSVHTVEINPDFYQTASRRLAQSPNVHMTEGHSVRVLEELIQSGRLGALPVFYLDAHWEEDWPLPRELELIRQGCPRAIIIIDDFRVPDQPQFPYDDYGGLKVCAFESILPHIDMTAAANNLLPRYTRAAVPEYITWVGHVVLFQNTQAEFDTISASQLANRHYFRLDVEREFPHLYGKGQKAVATDTASVLVASEMDLISHAAERDFPYLISFPRTGSHWLRMVLEMYFDRPLLTRSFFEHASQDYLLCHSHDMGMNLVRDNVMYLHRDPIDTVYSQLQYHGEDVHDLERIEYWADLYGQHAHKWLCAERFTHRKTILCYEDLRREPEIDFVAAIRHLGGEIDLNRLKDCLATVDRNRVKERTAHDQRVVNLHTEYVQQREQFRITHSATIWKAFLQGRDPLAARIGRPPVAVRANYAPAQHPYQTREGHKIIGLVPGKNEARHIEFCIRALAKVCDSIVYFDDNSTDDSLAIVESIAQECRVERIIRKRDGEFHETIRRALPLEAGRELGGTHFVVIDADETFTANLVEGDLLRRHILALQPGDALEVAWIQLWRSVNQYRHDTSVWTDNYKAFIFADDQKCRYEESFIHLERVPSGLGGKRYRLPGYEYGLMHFQFVNWRNLLVKQAWYRCLERIHDPRKSAQAINDLYAPSKDERELGLREVPGSWFEGYQFLDIRRLQQTDTWREQTVLDWFKEHGEAYFADLDIWDVDWGIGLGREPVTIPREAINEWVADGERQFAAGATGAARECFERALKYVPGHALALNNLAVMYWANGDSDKAFQQLSQALDTAPDNREIVFNAVQILSAMERKTDAIALCRSYLTDHPQDRALQGCLQNLDSQAVMDVGLGQAGSAIVDKSAASESGVTHVSNHSIADKLTPEGAGGNDLIQEGERLSAEGDLIGARAAFEQAVVVDASNAVAHNNLAVLSWQSGDTAQAIAHLAQALESDPDCRDAVLNGMKMLIALGKRDDAVALSNAWLSDYPGDAEIRLLAQSFGAEVIKTDGSGFQQTLSKGSLSEMDDEALAIVVALNEEGEQLFAAGNSDAARSKFIAAYELTPRDGATCNNLAVLAWQSGDIQAATTYLAQAMEAEPENSVFVINAVKLLSEGGCVADALAMCVSYLHECPIHPELNKLRQDLEVKLADGIEANAPWDKHDESRTSVVGQKTILKEMDVTRSEPLVSVIVSTYNSENLLRDCLRDLEQQTIAERLEIIVVDSGSQQNEHSIVQDFQRIYTNIVYIRTEQRETIYAAWNRGVHAAKGRYITNANTDDAHHPQALEKLVSALENSPGVDMAYADCQWTNSPNQRVDSNSVFRTVNYPEYHPGLAMLFCFLGPHPVWRRSVFERIGFFDPKYHAAGDYEFQMRFIAAGLSAIKVSDVLSTFYQNMEGLTLGSEVSTQEAMEITSHYRKVIPISRLYPIDASDMDALARGWVAQGNLASAFNCPWIDHVASEPAYAEQCYRTALAIAPGSAIAWRNLIALLGRKKDWAECERLLSVAPLDIAIALIDSVKSRKSVEIECVAGFEVKVLSYDGLGGNQASHLNRVNNSYEVMDGSERRRSTAS